MSDTDPTRAMIVGSVRTLAQFIPSVGGAVAQAWSEYDSYKQNERVKTFFEDLGKQLQSLKDADERLAQNVRSLPDAAETLERCVAAARREASDTKRVFYSRIYCSFLAEPGNTTQDERINMIQEIEQLTEGDFHVLYKFASQKGVMRGDMLTETVQGGWTGVGEKPPDTEWLKKHGGTVHSIAKLTGRGLITETEFNGMFNYVGEPGSSFNRFRERAWTLTPIAFKLLEAIGSIE